MGGNSIYIWLLVGLFALVVNFFIASFIAKAAEERGRSFNVFFWLSFLFSWIVMAIVLALLPAEERTPVPSQVNNQSKTRECPKCAEEILEKANYCKHCHSDVEPVH